MEIPYCYTLSERVASDPLSNHQISLTMNLYVYVEYLAPNGTCYGCMYGGLREYESGVRRQKQRGCKVLESCLRAYEPNPENPFELGELVASTKDVDCYKIQF